MHPEGYRALFIAALMTAAASVSFAQAPVPDPLVKENATTKLAPHTYAISDGNVPLVPNVGIIVGTRAALVIDPGLGKRNGEAVIRELRKLTPATEIYVAATHFHAEHTTGYAAFSAPAKFISSSIQEAEFAEGGAQQIQLFSGRSPMTAELLKGATAPKVDIRFDRDYQLDLDGVRVHFIVVGPTHTKGDTAIFVEGDNVLFAGDVVMNNSFLAATATSSMKAWLTAFDTLEKLRATVIVPSHGPIGDASLIPLNRSVMLGIQARTRELKKMGQSADDAAATVQKEFQAKYPNWPRANGITAAARSAYTEAP